MSLEYISLAERIIDEGLTLGAKWVEARIENTSFEYIHYLQGRVKEVSIDRHTGIGIRVLTSEGLGFACCSGFKLDDALKALNNALKIAKTSRNKVMIDLSNSIELYIELRNYRLHPIDLSFEDKIKTLKEVYKEASNIEEACRRFKFADRQGKVSSISVRYGSYYGEILIANSSGTKVLFKPMLSGLLINVITADSGKRGDGYSVIGTSRGIDKIMDYDIARDTAIEALGKALEKLNATHPKAGFSKVITSPSISGVFAHESFGHMSEGDFAVIKATPLVDKIGERLGSEYATIIDSGVVEYEDGFYYPVDSEGIPTTKVVLLNRGVFKGFMHDRETAYEYKVRSTGNGRAQDYSKQPIVRMRNTYFEAGDWRYEEMVREARNCILVDDERGGEASLDGTFTFTASRGYIIENGEIKKPIRDIVLTGNILEMLKYITGASREVKIYAEPFGACGKSGQSVYVGLGGPYLLVEKLRIGGRV